MIPPTPSAPPIRARRRSLPWIAGALAAIVAFSAILRGTRGEPEARRSLMLRAGEVVGWIARDFAAPSERGLVSGTDGAADAAPAWRDVLAAVEASIALDLRGSPRLPSLASDEHLAQSLRLALGARRFTPFTSPDQIVADPWSRRAAIFARLLANGCAAPADRGRWLEAAIALAADLRSIGTLAAADSAAVLEDAAATRLKDDPPLATPDAQLLIDRLLAAQRRLPRAEFIALRETRALQATICALAEIPPLTGAALRADGEPPVSVLSADDAVSRLDHLPGLLYPLLSAPRDAHATGDWTAFVDDFARRLPRLSTLLPTPEAIAAATNADTRLARLLDLLGARSPDGTAR